MIFTSDNWAGAHPAVAASLSAHSTRLCPRLWRERPGSQGRGEIQRDIRAGRRGFLLLARVRPPIPWRCRPSTGRGVCRSATGKPMSSPMNAARLNSSATGRGSSPSMARKARWIRQILKGKSRAFPRGFVHAGQPMAITLTQATEAGTVYTADEILTLSTIAKAHGLPLHMERRALRQCAGCTGPYPCADDP